MDRVHRIYRFLLKLPRMYQIGGVVVILVSVMAVHFFTRAAAAPDASPTISHVTIASVSSLGSQAGPLPVTGKVTSLNHASILAQSAGEITSLRHALGDAVGAGEVIAQFDNSAQQAALLQAQGAYDAAQAALARATGTNAANSTISSNQASQGAVNARTSAIASLQSTYAALDDAVHTKADTLFNNPRGILPTLVVTIPDSQLTATLQNERSDLENVLADAKTFQNVSANGDVDAAINNMTARAQTVTTFLTNLVTAANELQASQNLSSTAIAGYQASVGAARSEVVGAMSALTAAKTAYDAAQSGAQSAANAASGGTTSDIASAQASVKSALGALNGAKAALEKTNIRSPISGTIVSLPITRGDYVSMFNPVAEVSNPHALQVETYVTADDAKTLAVGNAATITDTIKGMIVSIAPALDPTTNKIKVVVAITGSQSTLTDGETVTVALSRSVQTSSSKTSNTNITVPIVAIKVTPEGSIVFTVASSSSTTATSSRVLVSHSVKLGSILGDRIVITDGLTPEMDIVADARGLSDGQAVIIDTKQ